MDTENNLVAFTKFTAIEREEIPKRLRWKSTPTKESNWATRISMTPDQPTVVNDLICRYVNTIIDSPRGSISVGEVAFVHVSLENMIQTKVADEAERKNV